MKRTPAFFLFFFRAYNRDRPDFGQENRMSEEFNEKLFSECPVALGANGRIATNSPEMAKVFELAGRYFSLLSDPTRLKMLHFASMGERSVTDFTQGLGITQTNASRHLGLLHQAGLLRRRRQGKRVLYVTRDPDLIKTICHACARMIHKITAEKSLDEDLLGNIVETSEEENLPISELLPVI
jgi:DNA-binding transcriptional ArsR family regulator